MTEAQAEAFMDEIIAAAPKAKMSIAGLERGTRADRVRAEVAAKTPGGPLG